MPREGWLQLIGHLIIVVVAVVSGTAYLMTGMVSLEHRMTLVEGKYDAQEHHIEQVDKTIERLTALNEQLAIAIEHATTLLMYHKNGRDR